MNNHSKSYQRHLRRLKRVLERDAAQEQLRLETTKGLLETVKRELASLGKEG